MRGREHSYNYKYNLREVFLAVYTEVPPVKSSYSLTIIDKYLQIMCHL